MKRLLLTLALVCLCAVSARAQSSFTVPVTNTAGNAIPGATVTYTCLSGGCGSNSYVAVTDKNGNAQFSNVAAGRYTVTTAGPGISLSSYTQDVPLAGNGAAICASINVICVDGVTYPTIAAAITAAGANKSITVPSGTYTLTAPLQPLAGQRIKCESGAILKQAAGANLTSIVDFNAHSANGASLEHCTVDGNLANNTPDLSNLHYLVNIGSANGVTLEYNTFQNSPSLAVNLTTGTDPTIQFNTFLNITTLGINLYTGVPFTPTHAQIHDNFFLPTLGSFPIGLQFSDGNTISRNQIIGTQAIQVVNTSGTAVSYVSGTNFAGLTVGMYCRITNVEYQIAAIGSNASLTLASSAGTQTNANSICGTADLINLDSSSLNSVIDNKLFFGMSSGVVVHQFALNTETSAGNTVSQNIVEDSGNTGISVNSTIGATDVDVTNVTGNTVINADRGSLAGSGSGIGISGPETFETYIADNVVKDFSGSTNFGIFVNSNVPAGTQFGPNFVNGAASGGVGGVFCTNTELSLSAGWQSTGNATATAVQGQGSTCSWTITTGTTTAANPTITDTLTIPLQSAAVQCWIKIDGGTHTAVAGEAFHQTTYSATAPVFTANFTPTANGFTYFVTRGCGP